jgi:hypothetical protein
VEMMSPFTFYMFKILDSNGDRFKFRVPESGNSLLLPSFLHKLEDFLAEKYKMSTFCMLGWLATYGMKFIFIFIFVCVCLQKGFFGK